MFLSLLLPPVTMPTAAPAAELMLNENEEQWLKNTPVVVYTGDPNWLPYEAFDSDGNYIGIVAEHLRLIEELTGLQFTMNPVKTWREATEKAKQGSVDVLSETDDSDLKSHLNFTVPYLSNIIVIAMHSRENYVEGISDIKHKKIALIRDYGYTAKIRRKYPEIQFVNVDNIQDGLLSVSTGEVDALLCTLALCSYAISEIGLNNVRITGKTEFDTKLAFGVQKDLPELLSILNKAIAQISQEQRMRITDQWIKDKFANKTDYTLVYQVVVVAIALLSIIVLWNIRLSREVELRRSTEKELKSAQDVLRLSLQKLSFHREHTPLGVIEWNIDFQVVSWNQAAENIFGYSKEEMQQPHATKRILPQSAREAVDEIWDQLITNTGGTHSRNENVTKDGRIIQCEWYNTPLVDPEGKVIGVASLVDDVTERTMSEEMIWKQANFDQLTGLPNRNMFHDRLVQEVIKADRDRTSLALLLIDLDQFKVVNDTLGHDMGDVLLKEAGKRITDCVRHSDTVARIGGDEFTVILSEISEDTNIEILSQKIIKRLEEEFLLGDEIVHISASIGITLYPNDASDIDTLIKNADQAMYAAKQKGRHCFSYFTQSLQEAAQHRLRLTNDLRIALRQEQFELYFQPIIDLKSGRIVKAETLVRWHHPQRGAVSPTEFIHLAEETGMINQLGDWVFTQSVHRAAQWCKHFNDEFQVSVNMSPAQFRLDTQIFISEWQHYLQQSGVSGGNVIIEITEGLLLNAEPDVIDKLLWLRDAGIQVAIDDFGTGYSSLAYLKKFDIDYLKIDKVFVHNLDSSENDIALCNAIIVVAHTLGLKVVAEGVETERQRQILAEAGCDFAQGYLFSRPVDAASFEKLSDTRF
ncbi:MAG: EAL domain-containing protein [Gammaproteobacteria bacterium]|nr:EAL domain-containing protein [Gammaproteobacteria bacterium]